MVLQQEEQESEPCYRDCEASFGVLSLCCFPKVANSESAEGNSMGEAATRLDEAEH